MKKTHERHKHGHAWCLLTTDVFCAAKLLFVEAQAEYYCTTEVRPTLDLDNVSSTPDFDTLRLISLGKGCTSGPVSRCYRRSPKSRLH
jgi:hypothetical protein